MKDPYSPINFGKQCGSTGALSSHVALLKSSVTAVIIIPDRPMQDVMEAATEAEADPHTPRTPTTEDLEYDLAGTRQTSDYQGSPALGPLPGGGVQDPSCRDSFSSQVQVSADSSLLYNVTLTR